jgi:hypothetical protein
VLVDCVVFKRDELRVPAIVAFEETLRFDVFVSALTVKFVILDVVTLDVVTVSVALLIFPPLLILVVFSVVIVASIALIVPILAVDIFARSVTSKFNVVTKVKIGLASDALDPLLFVADAISFNVVFGKMRGLVCAKELTPLDALFRPKIVNARFPFESKLI